MRIVTSTALALMLLVSNADASTKSVAPLSAGKPAGTKEAALLGSNLFLVLLSAGIVIGGISLAVSNVGSKGLTTSTSTSTSTSTAALP